MAESELGKILDRMYSSIEGILTTGQDLLTDDGVRDLVMLQQSIKNSGESSG